MPEVRKTLSKYKNLGLSTLAAGASWVGFAKLNTYLFPVREKISENLATLAYFEAGKATFQGAVGLMGIESTNLLYGTRFDKATRKIFGEKGSLRQKITSAALSGTVVEGLRTALAYKYILADKLDPNYVYAYLVEPRQTFWEEIVRSVAYSLAFIYVANKVRKHLKKTNPKTSEIKKV